MIEIILDFLKPLFVFNPIEGSIFIYFLKYTAIAITAGVLLQLTFFFWKPKTKIDASAIFAGPIEEGLFRILPLALTSSPSAFIGSIVWSLIHGHPSRVAFCMVMSFFYYRLCVSGLWYWAIGIHSLWNLLILILYKTKRALSKTPIFETKYSQ